MKRQLNSNPKVQFKYNNKLILFSMNLKSIDVMDKSTPEVYQKLTKTKNLRV